MTSQATDTPATDAAEKPAAVPDFRIDAGDDSTWPKVGTVYTFEVAAGDRDPRGDLPGAAMEFSMTVGECLGGKRLASLLISDGPWKYDVSILAWNKDWAPHVQESRLPKPEMVTIVPPPPAGMLATDTAPPHLNTLPIDEIIVDEDARLRRSFDETALVQLGESMSGLGQLQPIVVNRAGPLEEFGTFTLIAGERRLKAAQAAGATTIEAKVFRDLTDRQIADMRLAENLDRRDLTHVEVAAALARASEAGETIAELAGRIHKSDDFVREHMRLMDLCPPVLELVADGTLPSKQAAVIARLKDPDEQIKVAARALGAYAAKKSKTGWRIDGPMGWVTSLAHLVAKSHKVVSIAGVADEVAGKLGDLAGAGAGWPMDVEYAKRQACAGCEHNSETTPALFAEVVGAAGKGGRCADKKCFQAKRRKWANDPANVAAAKKKKAAKKAADQAAKRKDLPAGQAGRPFPETPAEHLAVLTHTYGVGLSEVVLDFVKKGKGLPDDAAETALAVAVAISGAAGGKVYLGLGLPAAQVGKLTAALAAGAAIGLPAGLAIGAIEDAQTEISQTAEPEYYAYNGNVANVPTPPAAIKRLDVLEALAARWKVPMAPEFVRPGRLQAWFACRTASGQRWTARITGAKKADDAVAAINECDDVAVLRELTCGEKSLAGKLAEVADRRIFELDMKTAEITGGTKVRTSRVIAAEKTVAVLVAAQDLGLTGDWRRAAVAKRIDELVWPAAGKKKKKKKQVTTKGTEGSKAKKKRPTTKVTKGTKGKKKAAKAKKAKTAKKAKKR